MVKVLYRHIKIFLMAFAVAFVFSSAMVKPGFSQGARIDSPIYNIGRDSFVAGVTGQDVGKAVEAANSYLYNSSKTGCKAGSPTSCAPYCKYEQKEECTLCPLFAIVFNTVSTITATSIDTFSNSVALVVLVGFSIWLAIQILLFVSSMETRDLKDLVQSILSQGFLVVLVVFILKTGVSEFFNGFINPIYETGQSLAGAVFDDCTSGTPSLNCSAEDASILQRNAEDIREISHGLPQSMGNSIINTMTMMENRARKFKALGNSLMCQSWKEGFLFIPKFSYLLSGLGIFVFSMLIIIGVPFLMLDAVLQLGVAGALLPIAVGCFAFKSTRQYSKKVWETFLNSMFAFLFISIIVLILLGVLQEVVADSSKLLTRISFDALFVSGSFQESDFEEILQSFNWTALGFLKLAFVFLLAWSVMNTAKEFAGEFASSISETSIGSSIGTMAASTAKGMALKAAKPLASKAGEKAKEWTSRGIQSIPRGIRALRYAAKKSKLEDTKQSLQAAAQQAGASGGSYQTTSNDGITTTTVQNGVVTQVATSGTKTTTTTLKNGVTSSVQTENGRKTSETREKNGIITNITYGKDGARIEVERSENFTITRKYDKSGKLLRQNAKANTRAADRILYNAQGDFDKKELDNLLKGMSDEQKKATFAAVAEKINKNRINDNNRKGRIVSEEIVASNYDKGYVEIKKVTNKGEVIFEKLEISATFAKSSVSIIDSKGKVMQLSSDGIHNKIEKFRLETDTDVNSVKNSDDILTKREKDADGNYKKSKIAYGYTAWYSDALAHGMDYQDINQGMLSEQEAKDCYKYVYSPGNEFGKAEINWSFRQKK